MERDPSLITRCVKKKDPKVTRKYEKTSVQKDKSKKRKFESEKSAKSSTKIQRIRRNGVFKEDPTVFFPFFTVNPKRNNNSKISSNGRSKINLESHIEQRKDI